MISVESGFCIGVGGTNARVATCRDGDIDQFSSIPTPGKAKDFFVWMAQGVLKSAEDGAQWLVAGFPGPVSPDGKYIGPMANVPGVANDRVNLHTALEAADPAIGRLLAEDFRLVAVNDGELSAHAAATRMGAGETKIASLIIGSGIGAGMVRKDPVMGEVYRSSKVDPSEVGHIPLSDDPQDTFENRYSGPALARKYKVDSTELLPDGHPAWQQVGRATLQISILLGLMHDAELVVPCGGVGAGASEKYVPSMNSARQMVQNFGNETQRTFLPEIKPVPQSECQTFEMRGAESIIRDLLTNPDTRV